MRSLCDVTQGTFSQVFVPPFQHKALLVIHFKARTNKSSCSFSQKLKTRFFLTGGCKQKVRHSFFFFFFVIQPMRLE